MFTSFKKIFGQGKLGSSGSERFDPVSEWAVTQGFSVIGSSTDFLLSGKVNNKEWKLERGRSKRDFIVGDELRARAQLGIDPQVAVLIINRPLKDSLLYQACHFGAQATSEEMRWLSTYTEVSWESLSSDFWSRYAVYTSHRECALAWVDTNLAQLLMSWPEASTDANVPFILMLLRGKAYLRMQYTPEDLSTLEHAATVYTSACESAFLGLCEYLDF